MAIQYNSDNSQTRYVYICFIILYLLPEDDLELHVDRLLVPVDARHLLHAVRVFVGPNLRRQEGSDHGEHRRAGQDLFDRGLRHRGGGLRRDGVPAHQEAVRVRDELDEGGVVHRDEAVDRGLFLVPDVARLDGHRGRVHAQVPLAEHADGGVLDDHRVGRGLARGCVRHEAVGVQVGAGVIHLRLEDRLVPGADVVRLGARVLLVPLDRGP